MAPLRRAPSFPPPSTAPCTPCPHAGSPFPSPLGRDAKWLSCRSAVDMREIPVHPDRNATCESFRKMVARQRERSHRGVRERRAQGVERLGVILSLSPCPPRRFARHAWVCAPPRRERRGQGWRTPTTLTRIASPPPRLPPSRLSLPDRKPGSGRGAARGARGAPHSRGRRKGGVTLQPCRGVRQP